MNRKKITLLLSVAIFSSFFMPLFEWHSFEMNGLNYILSTHIAAYKYFLLLIPFSAVLLFLGALYDESYLLNKNLMSALPFVASVFVLVMKFLTRDSASGGNIFSEVNLGFWMMLGFSMLLMLIKDKKRILKPY